MLTRAGDVTVRIIENPATPPEAAVWRLADSPAVRIGGDGVGAVPLFRVGGAVRLSDGRIVVADGGALALRWFDPTGAQDTAIGRDGEGPGEFRGFSYLAVLPGDSVVVADFRLARITVFDANGSVRREARWGAGPNSPRAAIVGVFRDGSLLGRGFVAVETPPPHGQRNYPQTFFHLDANGALADTLGDFQGGETYFKPIERGFQVERALFGRLTTFVAAGDRFYVAPNDRYEIRVYSRNGTPLQLVRRAYTERAVSAEDAAAERASRLAQRDAAQRATYEALLAEMPVPETMPAFDRIFVDDALNIWVREYRPAYEPGNDNYSIFDRDGVLIAALTAPAGFQPTHIGLDFVLGTWTDDAGVEYVLLYPLTR